MCGDVLFFPSAGVEHKNADLAEGDRRASCTFYLAGGLLRWIQQGFKNQTPEAKELGLNTADIRWEEGWSMYPTVKDIMKYVADHVADK